VPLPQDSDHPSAVGSSTSTVESMNAKKAPKDGLGLVAVIIVMCTGYWPNSA
jgi:hypothetical protein